MSSKPVRPIVRRRMLAAGAHYVVDTIAELPAVIAEINRKLEIL